MLQRSTASKIEGGVSNCTKIFTYNLLSPILNSLQCKWEKIFPGPTTFLRSTNLVLKYFPFICGAVLQNTYKWIRWFTTFHGKFDMTDNRWQNNADIRRHRLSGCNNSNKSHLFFTFWKLAQWIWNRNKILRGEMVSVVDPSYVFPLSDFTTHLKIPSSLSQSLPNCSTCFIALW